MTKFEMNTTNAYRHLTLDGDRIGERDIIALRVNMDLDASNWHRAEIGTTDDIYRIMTVDGIPHVRGVSVDVDDDGDTDDQVWACIDDGREEGACWFAVEFIDRRMSATVQSSYKANMGI